MGSHTKLGLDEDIKDIEAGIQDILKMMGRYGLTPKQKDVLLEMLAVAECSRDDAIKLLNKLHRLQDLSKTFMGLEGLQA